METTSELKVFCENLLDGETIGATFFYNLANVARVKIEAERNWKILEDEDATQSASVGDTFLTIKDLPSDFDTMIELFTTRADGSGQQYYSSIPFKKRYTHRLSAKRYYIDYVNNEFALCGTIGEARTIHLVYKKTSAAISNSQAWEFPTRFMPILGFMVAVMWRAGTDYDDINVKNAIQNNKDAKELWEALIDWDTEIRLKEMEHQTEGVGAVDQDGLPVGEEKENIGLY